MSTLARGIKRHCADCDTAFYDMKRVPARCPKCGAEVDLKAGKRLVSSPRPPKVRAVRGAHPAAATVAPRPDAGEEPAAAADADAETETDEDDEDEDEADEAPDADEDDGDDNVTGDH